MAVHSVHELGDEVTLLLVWSILMVTEAELGRPAPFVAEQVTGVPGVRDRRNALETRLK
jgi:hypothetical protein